MKRRPQTRRTSRSAKKEKSSVKVKYAPANRPLSSPAGVASPLFPVPFKPLLALWIGWGLAILYFLMVPNFSLGNNGAAFLHFFIAPKWFLLAGFGLMIYGFRKGLGNPTFTDDLSSFHARVCFWLILALGAFMRLHEIDEPIGAYWNDYWIPIVNSRNILERKWGGLLFGNGGLPVPQYFQTFVWFFIPSAKAVVVQRLSNILIDSGVIWFLYLLGKEVGSRKVGLGAALLAAISKPMILLSLTGMSGGGWIELAIVPGLFILVRIFKKPTFSRFCQLGLVIAFGAHTYLAFYPWMAVLVVIPLLYVLFQKGEDRISPLGWSLSIGLALFWIILFFYVNHALSPSSPLARVIANPKVEITLVTLFFALFLAVLVYPASEREKRLAYWAFGVFLAGAIMTPLMTRPDVTTHGVAVSVLSSPDIKSKAQLITLLWGKFNDAIQNLFIRWEDRADMNLVSYPFLEFGMTVATLLGVAFWVARWSWMSLFILMAFLVGLSPNLLTSDTYSMKSFGALPALFLTASLGLNGLLQLSRRTRFGWFLSTFSLLSLLGGVTLTAHDNWMRIYEDWDKVLRPDVIVERQAEKDEKDYRIYLMTAPTMGFFTGTCTVILEGMDAHLTLPSNTLYLAPGEKGKDLAVYVFIQDPVNQARLKADFPNAEWTLIQARQGNTYGPLMYRVVIPMAQVPEGPSPKLFHIQRVDANAWDRKLFWLYYGLDRGVIHWEDRTLDIYQPILVAPDGVASGRLTGTWNAPVAGTYQFRVDSWNYCLLFIDGEKVLDLRPREGTQQKTSGEAVLAAGPHSIKMVTLFQRGLNFPPVLVHLPAGLGEKTLAPTPATP